MEQTPKAKYLKGLGRIWGLWILLSMAGMATASPLLEGIHLSEKPSLIALRFDADVNWRVYQTGPREVLIALQNASVARDLTRSGSGAPVIQRIVYKRTGEGNATLIVETGMDIRSVESHWRAGVRILEIRLETTAPGPRLQAHKTPRFALENRKRLDTASAPQQARRPAPEPPSPQRPSPPSNGKAMEVTTLANGPKGHGGIDTLLDAILKSDCGGGVHMRIGVRNIQEDNCDMGMDVLAQGLMEGCEEVFSYLEGWCRFQKASSPSDLLALARTLEMLVAGKPDAPWVPWGYAMLGVVYHKMGNDPVGMGYFDLLREKAPNFAGMPEILLHLGRMHMRNQRLDEAEPLFRDLVTRFGETLFAREARMELGRVMFERKRYFETLKMLEAVMRDAPDRVFTDADLLLLVGNSHFHTGGYAQAIEALVRVYNDFPGLAEPSLVLTRIAESYAGLGEKEKAKRLYELVRELYPGTDGFVISSMRLAEMLEKREDRESIFQMVIDHYPDHTLARLALMRLAESRHQAGDYNETVRLIRRLLTEDPRALRRDALILMGRALEAMFQGFLDQGGFPEVIRRYEVEKGPVFEMENPRIHALVGRAFLDGHLYPQALPEYQRAEMLWGGAPVPPAVRFEYGVVAKETGNQEKALEQFGLFLKEVPKDPVRSAATWGHMGDIRYNEGKKEVALKAYETAAQLASQGQEKARFLHAASRILRDSQERGKEAVILERSLAFLDGEGQDSRELRFALLRSLGEAQVAQGLLAAAAVSYAKAEGLMGIPASDRNAVRFRHAETLEALGKGGEAQDLYRLLVEDGDPLWGALAQERLTAIRIEGQLRES
jgi:tetratricopeptide (TPR) repeat protein